MRRGARRAAPLKLAVAPGVRDVGPPSPAMSDDELEQPPRGYNTEDVAALPRERPPFFRRHRWKFIALAVLLSPVVVFALWAAIALSYTYSDGQRVGYVQKLSHRGWLCKTWEGELAMVSIPGSMPEIFHFSVRDDSLARVIQEMQGGRVALEYHQKKNVPTSCFGETEYHVVGVRQAPN
jgi:hypothetical protein